MHVVEGKSGPAPPDGGWGWAIVFASFMIHVIADGVAYTFGIFFIELSTDLNATKSATSWIASIMAGVTYASGPLAGAFVNKWGCRPVSVVGSVLATLGFAISYFAQGVTYLYISIGLLGGIGLGLIYLPAIVSVTCYFEQKRAFATGIAVCGSGVGTFLFAPLMQKLILEYGWRVSLLITAAILLHCLVFSLFFKPLPEKELPSPPSSPVSIFRTSNSMTNHDHPNTQPTICLNPRLTTAGFEPRDSVEPLLSPSHNKTPVQVKEDKGDTLAISTSHPVLPVAFKDSPYIPKRRHSLRVGTPVSSSQLITSRKDIFYSGSLANINQSEIKMTEPEPEVLEENRKRCCRCPPELQAALKEMMDFSILKNPVFLLFAVSNFFTAVGYNVPYIYIADMALSGGDNDKPSAGFLLSIIGISNTLSRVILGYLSDKPFINRLYLYNSALAICGLATGLVSHTTNILWLRVYAVTFGVTVGVYVSLTSVILVDLLGLESLTNAFGLLLLFQGIASLIGPPIVGKLFDVLRDYRWGFWLAGGMIGLSGLMLFFIPLLQTKKVKEKRNNTDKNNQLPS